MLVTQSRNCNPYPSPPPHTRPNVPQLVVPQRLDQVVHSSCCEALDDLLMLAACANCWQRVGGRERGVTQEGAWRWGGS
eukprot:365067-Chlamydomonas_euryale.AAC.29